MRAVRREDTAVELRLRRALWATGLRYRLRTRLEGIRPDLCFLGARLVVFVDGCFWHGCPEHYVAPAANADFWRLKIERNRSRDRQNDESLRAAGWRVFRCWECEVERELERVVGEVRSTLNIPAPEWARSSTDRSRPLR